ncbi:MULTISPECIES: hypothetical protein [Caballeronia]|uniref:Abortive infection protein-like C-terminal domain-containing protein n=1 Tax=Caballeronia zhejiangensis TaxID=871203 RepID=A0A656QKN4_9BURK|nr:MULTISPECIES: hypothetical protein [Caballeronia]KDR28494.1 hypothetical protein BG60_11270 [Caballeronia zhejiangensis]MCE4547877.1 hypothetical protein [Caballeronia sp. PC1]MCE4575569.1 hypothetical protein [Caballeronia sp. CLC5]
MLQFDQAWRYESPGVMPDDVVDAVFSQVISRLPAQGSRQDVYELFKPRFAACCGESAGRSSSESWAVSDLLAYMRQAAGNAALFVEALYDALQDFAKKHPQAGLPPWHYVNDALAPSGFAIDPPRLVAGRVAVPVAVPAKVPSLDEQANDRIQRSLSESERLLNTGKYRLAVQEILWLLETVSTAFQGLEHEDGTVTGKYFNRIIGDLKRFNRGRVLSEAISWIEKLHGYLSSPSGGGVRHGAVLSDAYELTEGEARLFCDLTRSYLTYLLHEHQRLGVR